MAEIPISQTPIAVRTSFPDEASTFWELECPAGHYVKMVHNGIEYDLMQLISETYERVWFLATATFSPLLSHPTIVRKHKASRQTMLRTG
jgi:6-phosphogluconate dehydrogenase (decarboxylating)